jgi:hypothetical protein
MKGTTRMKASTKTAVDQALSQAYKRLDMPAFAEALKPILAGFGHDGNGLNIYLHEHFPAYSNNGILSFCKHPSEATSVDDRVTLLCQEEGWQRRHNVWTALAYDPQKAVVISQKTGEIEIIPLPKR